MTRSQVLNPERVKWFDTVTVNPKSAEQNLSALKKSRKYAWRQRYNPRRKRQKKISPPTTDDQIEIPEVSQGTNLSYSYLTYGFLLTIELTET